MNGYIRRTVPFGNADRFDNLTRCHTDKKEMTAPRPKVRSFFFD